jgi:hypothetical protein
MSDSSIKKSVPGPLPVSTRLNTFCMALMFVGALAFVLTLFKNADRAWHAYVTAYFYFFVLAIGGLFFTGIHHLTNAGWSVNVRRFCEALTAFLPIAAVGALLLVFAGHHLYEWMDKAKVAADPLLADKAPYLNVKFFVIRVVFFFGAWLLYQSRLVGYSVRQDATGDEALTRKASTWSSHFMLFFALSFSFFSVDLIMSLQPHWYSTIFGVYCFGGLFQSTIALMILLIIYCIKKGLLNGYVDENHMHDLGKYLFAFTIFWAYIAYAQYMLIWYANLPEETIFYIPRVAGSWTWVSLSLLVFKFGVPFVALLSRRGKRNMNYLATIAVLILIMQYVDIYWMVYPNLSQDVIFGLPEILIFAGFAGAFLFTTFRFLNKNSIIPLKDPRIHESLHHHVVY